MKTHTPLGAAFLRRAAEDRHGDLGAGDWLAPNAAELPTPLERRLALEQALALARSRFADAGLAAADRQALRTEEQWLSAELGKLGVLRIRFRRTAGLLYSDWSADVEHLCQLLDTKHRARGGSGLMIDEISL